MLSRYSRTRWMIVAATILVAVVVFFLISRYGPLEKLLPSFESPAEDAPGGFLQFNRDRTLEIQPDARPAPPPADFVPGPADSEHLVGIWSTEDNAEYPRDADILATRGTVKECQRRCELAENCAGLTYNKYDGFYTRSCWLKSAMPATARVRNIEMKSLRLTNRT